MLNSLVLFFHSNKLKLELWEARKLIEKMTEDRIASDEIILSLTEKLVRLQEQSKRDRETIIQLRAEVALLKQELSDLRQEFKGD